MFECRIRNLKNTFKPRSLTRSLKAIFGTKKRPSTHQRLPDAYYKNVWFSKNMYEGIELVARIEKISNKKAAHLLIEDGFRKYIGQKMREAVRTEIAVDELRQKPHLTRFVLELRKSAKERGMDIKKVI